MLMYVEKHIFEFLLQILLRYDFGTTTTKSICE